MTNAQAEEIPWDFERKPEKQEIRVTVDPREIYRGDGMMWELLRKIRQALGMASAPDRGPQDYDAFADERRLYQRLLREHHGGHGSVGGGGRHSWLRDAAIVVTLGLSAWTLKTVIEQGKDITRMQCQLSPATCQQVVVPRGQP